MSADKSSWWQKPQLGVAVAVATALLGIGFFTVPSTATPITAATVDRATSVYVPMAAAVRDLQPGKGFWVSNTIGGRSFFGTFRDGGRTYVCDNLLLPRNNVAPARFVTSSYRFTPANFGRVAYVLDTYQVKTDEQGAALNLFVAQLSKTANDLDKRTAFYLAQAKAAGANISAIKKALVKIKGMKPPKIKIDVVSYDKIGTSGNDKATGKMVVKVSKNGKPFGSTKVTSASRGHAKLAGRATKRTNSRGEAMFKYTVSGPGAAGLSVATAAPSQSMVVLDAPGYQFMVSKGKPSSVGTSVKWKAGFGVNVNVDCGETCTGKDAPAELKACNRFDGKILVQTVAGGKRIDLPLRPGRCGKAKFTVDDGDVIGPTTVCKAMVKQNGRWACDGPKKTVKPADEVVCGSWPIMGQCVSGDCGVSKATILTATGRANARPGTTAYWTIGGQTFSIPVNAGQTVEKVVNVPVRVGDVIRSWAQVPSNDGLTRVGQTEFTRTG